MIKITKLSEINRIVNPILRDYIFRKSTQFMTEYGVNNLDDIGCFVVLDSSENQMFKVSEMEFVEVLEIGKAAFLHGVRIVGDGYGEDIYLPIEVVKC